jgi:hypothetical protein
MKKTWIVVAAAIPLVLIALVAVFKVSDDGVRRQGALTDQDGVNLTWRGDWSEKAEYAAGNVVTHEGVSYVAEGEKLAAPRLECSGCGWTQLAVGSAGEESKPPPPPEPVMRAYQVVRELRTVPAGAVGVMFELECPTGKMPINGGGSTPSPPMKVVGGGVHRVTVANGVTTGSWGVSVDNSGGPQRDIYLFAACAKVD